MKIKTLYSTKERSNINIESYLTKCGVKNVEAYLDPTLSMPTNPKKYPNIDKAIEFMKELRFIFSNNLPPSCKKIYIVQDSDIDGILSAALTYKFLIHIGIDEKYIKVLYHSHKTHGLTDGIMEQILVDECSYLIIPDAGTNDIEKCEELWHQGVKILIIDHHDIVSKNPYAIIVNNQIDIEGVNPYLCGTGVVFKVISAFFNPDIWEIDDVYF